MILLNLRFNQEIMNRSLQCGLILTLFLCAFTEVWSQKTWTGAVNTSWSEAGNWSPSGAPGTGATIIFDLGGTVTVTNVTSITLDKFFVQNNTSVTIRPNTGSDRIITITNTAGVDVDVQPGSFLTVQPEGVHRLNFSLQTGGTARIGGQVTMENGNFGIGDGTLILHTNALPMNRIVGQFTLGTGATLQFGGAGLEGGPAINLPNEIFGGGSPTGPTFANLIINRNENVILGDQNLNISNQATMTDGDLVATGVGRVSFTATASNPIETDASKIIGFAVMQSRSVGTGALNFLGFNMAAGPDNVGNVSIIRRSTAIVFSSNTGIQMQWGVTSSSNPASGRDINLSWLPQFDNGTIPTSEFQVYKFTGGPGWDEVEGLNPLASDLPLRTTATVTTTIITDFTVADEFNTLPVQITGFRGWQEDKTIVLEWTTQQEINNSHFEVEKLNNDQEFVFLGRVEGSGSTQTPQFYRFTDDGPGTGLPYYRLKQVDFNGDFEYFGPVFVPYKASGEEYQIFPNPSNGQRFFITNSGRDEKEPVRVEILDNNGRIITTQNLQISGDGTALDTGRILSPGLYQVRLATKSGIINQKLVVR